ncbi:PAS domain S-box protein [Candidatus Methylospira mobilis]|uniref:PAS domain S-box protein n=1 Tax=Candidatus Methylospira mobilis TaxID=1808979 RepID=A0A5Q0BN06_9GAMM|nr:PAS domain S-box protein [Candidatus Methylospira mobilis]QFY43594.1 PAS domain S-box protein [Candidatus Methylospira mobilis]
MTDLKAILPGMEKCGLQESDKRLQNLGDSLLDSYLYEAICEHGGLKFLFVSSGVERINGVKAEDVINDASVLLDQIDSAQRSVYLEAAAASLRDLTSFEMDLRMNSAGGEWRWVHLVRSCPRSLENGRFIVDGIVTDITNRRLFETEISRLAQAVEQNPTGILIADLHGVLLFANQSYSRITGYQFAEAYGKTQRELISTEMSDEEFNAIKGSLNAGRSWSGVLGNRHKNGQFFWQQSNVSPMYDDSGQISSYLYLCTDVTKSKLLEIALRDAKDYAENLVQTANAIVIGVDIGGRVITFNRAAERITGYKAEDLEGRNWFEVIVPKELYPEVWTKLDGRLTDIYSNGFDADADSWPEFDQLLAGGLPTHFECPILTKSGGERYIVWQSNNVFEQGQIVGMISFGIDISEHKK